MAISVARKRALLLTAAGTFGVALVVFIMALLFGPIANRATPTNKDRAAAVNSTRQILLAAAAGTAALVGLGFTARTFYLSRRGQLTDRYTKAISQLASEKMTERLGGIYALEHLMRESSRDHDTVIAVLAAFIREQSRRGKAPSEKVWKLFADTDVQAALTVISRRPRRHEADPIDLSGADLNAVDLVDVNLDGVVLVAAFLTRAKLFGTSLRGALLMNASFVETRLDGALLQGAYLDDAEFRRAHLTDARLDGASISGAKFCGENDADAVCGLTIEQLSSVTGLEEAVLPTALRSALQPGIPPAPGPRVDGATAHGAAEHGP